MVDIGGKIGSPSVINFKRPAALIVVKVDGSAYSAIKWFAIRLAIEVDSGIRTANSDDKESNSIICVD